MKIRQPLLIALTAILIAIPCFWQEHIQACDLSSHLYNAWLANEAEAGHITGVYVAGQYTNVLFDEFLSFLLSKTRSVFATEHIAVIAAVEIFFWGCFTFVSVVSRRRAWSVLPLLLILTYGAIFRLGFFNFFIATGLCLFAVAIAWRDRLWERLIAAPILAVATTAHIFPCIWALGAIGYLLVARKIPRRQLGILLAGSSATLVVTAIAFSNAFQVRSTHSLRIESIFGADQAITWGPKYKLLAAALLCLGILALIKRCEFQIPVRNIVFHLWVLSAGACLLLPDAIWFPQYAASVSFITIRLSLMCAVLFCALISTFPLSRAVPGISGALSSLFFLFSFLDERGLNALESRVQAAVADLPPGARIVSNLADPSLNIQGLEHLVDRVCIGRCFDFGNYEPSTLQFRLRAGPLNSYVAWNHDDIAALAESRYVVNEPVPNFFQLVPCETSVICSVPLSRGERVVRRMLSSSVPLALVSERTSMLP